MAATTTIELVEPPTAALTKHVSEQYRPTTQDDPHPEAALSRISTRVENKGTASVIIATITGVTTISSLLSGLVTISLPAMVLDLNIPEALTLWPASVYSLACGCTLILCGAIADVVGARNMYLLGTFFQSAFTLACGLSRTSTQLIVFRALSGVAISLCLPSAVSLLTTYFAPGRKRNFAFGAMGGGQPLGYTVGLIMGGGLADSSVGWQGSMYIAAGLNSILFVFALFGLPAVDGRSPNAWHRLKSDIDWIGAFILSSSLALLLYVFATWTGNLANIRSAESVSCLTIGGALLPAFVVWINRQEKLGNPVLIRNSLWRNKAFTSICIMVFLVWGSFNATETFLTFLFQDVQGLRATQASIRFLPEPVSGATVNILIGLYVHKLRAKWALVASLAVSAVSPLLLAVMREGASYWEFEFAAVALVPIACDVLYTISQLVITAEFDENTQALAGGVFNTVAQIGKSVGLALSAVVASSITAEMDPRTSSHEHSLLQGYRGAWWFTFAATVICILITLWGLRHIGKVGLKRE